MLDAYRAGRRIQLCAVLLIGEIIALALVHERVPLRIERLRRRADAVVDQLSPHVFEGDLQTIVVVVGHGVRCAGRKFERGRVGLAAGFHTVGFTSSSLEILVDVDLVADLPRSPSRTCLALPGLLAPPRPGRPGEVTDRLPHAPVGRMLASLNSM